MPCTCTCTSTNVKVLVLYLSTFTCTSPHACWQSPDLLPELLPMPLLPCSIKSPSTGWKNNSSSTIRFLFSVLMNSIFVNENSTNKFFHICTYVNLLSSIVHILCTTSVAPSHFSTSLSVCMLQFFNIANS